MTQSYASNKFCIHLLASTVVWLVCLFLAGVRAQGGGDVLSRFEKTEAMIHARDGIRLHTLIYAPQDSREPLPFIMLRTPYGIDGRAGSFNSYLKDLAAEGYIFVFQDRTTISASCIRA